MNKLASPALDDAGGFRQLVEAVIFETNPDNLSRRIQDAQDAVMDQIEASFGTASQFERQSMINAMNSLRELRRLVQTPESQSNVRYFTDT